MDSCFKLGGYYSPLFAPITKLNGLRPDWSSCTAQLGWNGWDLSRTLEPATAIVAPVTSADPGNVQTTSAASSPTTLPLPINTGATADSKDP